MKEEANPSVRALPDASLAAVETPMVNEEPGSSGVAGRKVALRLATLYETPPVTAAPEAVTRRVTDDELIVAESMGSLNSITGEASVDTSVA